MSVTIAAHACPRKGLVGAGTYVPPSLRPNGTAGAEVCFSSGHPASRADGCTGACAYTPAHGADPIPYAVSAPVMRGGWW